jgi:hypothetical protein
MLSVATTVGNQITKTEMKAVDLVTQGVELIAKDYFPELTVSALDCQSRPLTDFELSVEADGSTLVWASECGSVPPAQPARCRKTSVHNGEARFFYVPPRPAKLRLVLTVKGVQSVRDVATDSHDSIRLLPSKGCDAGLKPPQCNVVERKLRTAVRNTNLPADSPTWTGGKSVTVQVKTQRGGPPSVTYASGNRRALPALENAITAIAEPLDGPCNITLTRAF